jgi:hypothetical protein
MDLYCKRCGEPYEYYYVQHDMEGHERQRFLSGAGCPSCYGKQPCQRTEDCADCPDRDPTFTYMDVCRVGRAKNLARRPFRAQLAAAMQEILGDDLDGLAAEMEDAEYLMGKAFWE